MKGQVVRYQVSHYCRPPGRLMRAIRRICLYDRWECPECGSWWEWIYVKDRAIEKEWSRLTEPRVVPAARHIQERTDG